MYGKIFASTFTGSMFGAGSDVFAVWGYVIANAQDSRIELNPRMLAATLGSTPEKVENAIEYLCRPDPESRNPEQEGRRLVREGQYQYLVVSHGIYRGLQDNDELRAYNRERQRAYRANKKGELSHGVVTDCHGLSRRVTTSNNASASASKEESNQGIGTAEDDEIPFVDGEEG